MRKRVNFILIALCYIPSILQEWGYKRLETAVLTEKKRLINGLVSGCWLITYWSDL